MHPAWYPPSFLLILVVNLTEAVRPNLRVYPYSISQLCFSCFPEEIGDVDSHRECSNILEFTITHSSVGFLGVHNRFLNNLSVSSPVHTRRSSLPGEGLFQITSNVFSNSTQYGSVISLPLSFSPSHLMLRPNVVLLTEHRQDTQGPTRGYLVNQRTSEDVRNDGAGEI